MHKHTQTTIDRALAGNVTITDRMVDGSTTLREVAIDYVQTYRGTNSFIQDLAVRLVDYGSLSVKQMRAALNQMIRDAREAAARQPAASDVTAIVDGQFYIDLRSTSEREAADAGTPPAVEDQPAADNTRVPSSRYTIVINPDTDEYRTLRLVDAPDHFNAAPGTQIAQYLSGADNEASYTSFAFVVGRTLRVWRRFSGDSKIVDALRILLAGDPVAHMIKYGMVFDRCAICGRALSTPESRRAGIGPICAGRVEAEGYSVAIPAEDRQAARSRAISDMAELFND